jgi:hypothetical protein
MEGAALGPRAGRGVPARATRSCQLPETPGQTRRGSHSSWRGPALSLFLPTGPRPAAAPLTPSSPRPPPLAHTHPLRMCPRPPPSLNPSPAPSPIPQTWSATPPTPTTAAPRCTPPPRPRSAHSTPRAARTTTTPAGKGVRTALPDCPSGLPAGGRSRGRPAAGRCGRRPGRPRRVPATSLRLQRPPACTRYPLPRRPVRPLRAPLRLGARLVAPPTCSTLPSLAARANACAWPRPAPRLP